LTESHEPDPSAWLKDFEAVLTGNDAEGFRMLFAEQAWWRDNVAFTWNYRQGNSRDDFEQLILRSAQDVQPRGLRISSEWPGPSVIAGDPDVYELFFSFETRVGSGTGLVHAHLDPSSKHGIRAWRLYTVLDSLNDSPLPAPHPRGRGFTPMNAKENWLASRSRRAQFLDREPEVLIVGGGHAGMMLAAHLGKLGVDTLVIERNERAGDNWRKRYHNLALHTPVEMTRFPYLSYPDHFPEYIPKDKLANWLESYAEQMDLQYWTSTEFLQGSYDEEAGIWSAEVRLADGSLRTLKPRELVMATGGNGGYPNIPVLPGIDDFKGELVHSSKFPGGEHYKGKKAIVLGVGTSAHDIAYDLYQNDVDVTMVQRNPVSILSIESANDAYGDYFRGVPDVLVDIRINAGKNLPLFQGALLDYQHNVVEKRDGELLKRLEAVGMKLEDRNDPERVWMYKYFTHGGGYYLNVGTSDLIADGKIKVIQWDTIDRFVENGALRKDGSVLEAAVVVAATGYEPRQSEVVKLFGEELSEKIGAVARGFDADGEWANVWKRTPQRGLWFILGGIETERQNTWQVALMIKSDLLGIVPEWVYRTHQIGPEASTAVGH